MRLVTVARLERGLPEAQLTQAAGVSESEVRRFEVEGIAPAEPLAMRFIEAMRLPQQKSGPVHSKDERTSTSGFSPSISCS